ncbi:glycosyltransferase family 2 protein [Testudinibacter aquarius]|uniref:Glycosyltransferase n=1 Tax=Testudinibacter aquarius TaxID=1524974 RepID=A0A4R3XWW4_9PAST|nr:glycosyltransferase [Testudinibacter aquarius]KAE9530986.1 glycosyl transferase [Testudinibacter aquarius]TCV83341.1 glycosyltransferase involved in cell wall biosynthesis [Testudinibacter aquarius]TNG91199.1 glycosyltransferase [Testudinibacter aquarius]
MTKKLPITVTMLVNNSEKYLSQVLTALTDFDEVLLLDNGSTDSTLTIAQRFDNVVVYHSPFIGFGPLKNLAAQQAKHDWIINIDSDEVFPEALINELKTLDLTETNKAYAILRLNHYRGKVIKTCGWYPDYVKRLYNRTLVTFNDKQVHESLDIPQNVELVKLKQHFLHYSFDGASALINKMQQYTTLFAEQNKFKKRASVFSAITHGVSAFIKNYLLKKGFLDGQDGFVIACANAMGAYYKYIKLMEANQRLQASLIVTTYNRPDALSAVLQSVLVQKTLPKEVIIADDGSTDETKTVIEQYQAIFPVPLIHSWQPDTGFKLAESRNRALAQATADYIVVIDGDMVMHSQFIQDHLKAAKKGIFIQGSRVVLPQPKTAEILKQPTKYPEIKWYQKGIEKRLEKRLSACHLPWLNSILHKEKRDYYKGIRGCNMAFFREDALAVNGFNNDFVGWGREDSEFVARLFNNGVKRKDIRFAAIAYHLWHNEAERDALPENDRLLKNVIEQKLTTCENGVARFLNHSTELMD